MRATAISRLVIAIAALACLALLSSDAQESKEEKSKSEEGTQKKDDFFTTDAGMAAQWAVGMFGPVEPLGTLGVRVLATDERAGLVQRVDLWKFVFTEPLPIYARYVQAIKDERPEPVFRVEKGKPLPESWQPDGPDWGWYLAFSEALRRSNESDVDMFKTAAEHNGAVDFARLKKSPQKYRGKIITVTGRLTKVRKLPAPPFVPEELEHYYAGYLVESSLGWPPVAVAFTEMPAKLEVGEELSLSVTFHGYFLSLVRTPADKKEGAKEEDVPYLVGKTPIVNAADVVWPIDNRYLEAIEDRRPLPKIAVVKGEPIPEFWTKPGGPDWGWYMAFNDAVRRCQDTDKELFKKGAEEHKNLVYADLKNSPKQHRGKIVTVTGKLTVLRASPAPRYVREQTIYNGYIVGPTPGAPPFAVAFTELPDKVEPGEKLDLNVTFHGYFLSLVRFPSDKKGAKKEDDIISPYLVGKELIVHSGGEKKKEENTSFAYPIVVSTVGGIVLIAIIVALLNVWLRRGDQRIQAQLNAVREKTHKFDLEPADPEPETGIKPTDAPGEGKPPVS